MQELTLRRGPRSALLEEPYLEYKRKASGRSGRALRSGIPGCMAGDCGDDLDMHVFKGIGKKYQ